MTKTAKTTPATIKSVTLVTEGRVAGQYMPKTIALDIRLGGYLVEAIGKSKDGLGVCIASGPNKVEIPLSNIASIEYA